MLAGKRRDSTSPRFCAIALSDQGLATACAKQTSNQELYIESCSFIADINQDNLADALAEIVRDNQLKHVPCYWVLTNGQYQLLQIENLNVPENELRAAVGWRIKESLDFPLQEAVFDIFPSPVPMPGQSRKSLYIAAAQQNLLQQVTQQIKKSGLQPAIIDISELALRNVAMQFHQDKQALAVLTLTSDASHLVITCSDELYFSRQLGCKLDPTLFADGAAASAKVDDVLHALVLEIRRCYDYYISQLRQLAPAKLLLVPMFGFANVHEQRLHELLAMDMSLLDLMPEFAETSDTIDAGTQRQCVLALGGLLRGRVKQHVAAD